jgi:hypothetical protein
MGDVERNALGAFPLLRVAGGDWRLFRPHNARPCPRFNGRKRGLSPSGYETSLQDRDYTPPTPIDFFR